MRVGIGYDVHAFKKGEKFTLGGVVIESDYGLLGHSDADVLVHSIMDAMLGAAGLNDIGIHFPDNNEDYKDISSLVLLRIVNDKVKSMGFKIINIDSVVVLEIPKIASYIKTMREKISRILGIKENNVNIKATTSEGLGFCGRKEGVAAHSVALLQ